MEKIWKWSVEFYKGFTEKATSKGGVELWQVKMQEGGRAAQVDEGPRGSACCVWGCVSGLWLECRWELRSCSRGWGWWVLLSAEDSSSITAAHISPWGSRSMTAHWTFSIQTQHTHWTPAWHSVSTNELMSTPAISPCGRCSCCFKTTYVIFILP